MFALKLEKKTFPNVLKPFQRNVPKTFTQKITNESLEGRNYQLWIPLKQELRKVVFPRKDKALIKSVKLCYVIGRETQCTCLYKKNDSLIIFEKNYGVIYNG